MRKAAEESIGVDATDLEKDSVADQGPVLSAAARQPSVPQITSSPAMPSQPAAQTNINGSQALVVGRRTNGTGSASKPVQPSAPLRTMKASENRNFTTHNKIPTTQSDRPPRSGSTKSDVPLETLTDEWSCPTCTLVNPSLALTCEACASPRPRPPQRSETDVWYCEFCGAGPREMDFWSCLECGWVRKWG